jgi:hypothetical protein
MADEKTVTLDKVVKFVGEFDGDLDKGQKNYEQAKQGKDIVKEEKAAFAETLKDKTGFGPFNLPQGAVKTPVSVGDVDFTVKSTYRRRLKFKDAVQDMENYLKGIHGLVWEGRTITGVVKEGKSVYISAEKLLDTYDQFIFTVMAYEIRHDIKYDAKGALATEGALEEIVLKSNRDPKALTPSNAAAYVRLDRVEGDLKDYAKQYEAKLAETTEKTGKKTVAVTADMAYDAEKETTERVDWGYVVRTLIKVPTQEDEDEEGEINTLADETVSLAEKQRELPWFKTLYHEVRGQKKTYVSIESVYQRIQDLKTQQSIAAETVKVTPKQIV